MSCDSTTALAIAGGVAALVTTVSAWFGHRAAVKRARDDGVNARVAQEVAIEAETARHLGRVDAEADASAAAVRDTAHRRTTEAVEHAEAIREHPTPAQVRAALEATEARRRKP